MYKRIEEVQDIQTELTKTNLQIERLSVMKGLIDDQFHESRSRMPRLYMISDDLLS